MRTAWVLVVVHAALAACGDDDCCAIRDAGPDDGATVDAFDPYVEVSRVPVVINRDLDLLFVIDDSPGSQGLQTLLKNEFNTLLNVLNTVEGGLPNLHLGVVSTDVGTRGRGDASAGPALPGPGACAGNGKAGDLQTNNTSLVAGSFINDQKNTDGTRTQNYSPGTTLSTAFGALASLGETGCAYPQAIHAAYRALDNNPSNAGFRRPNAHLGVAFVTAHDDCSMEHSTLLGSDAALGPLTPFRCTRFGVTCDGDGTTPDMMATPGTKTSCHANESSPYMLTLGSFLPFFEGLRASPASLGLYIGAIVGPLSPVDVVAGPALAASCTTSPTTFPGTRLAELAATSPTGRTGAACNSDLSEPLVNLGLDLVKMIGSSCITYQLVTPLDCHCYETSGGSTTELPMCPPTGGTDCWRIVQDQQTCFAAAGMKLVVMRDTPPPIDTIVSLRCLVQ